MIKNDLSVDCSLISRYRTLMMGIAIIFIMFCHMDVALSHNGMESISIARALHIFTVGVDMFLFLSGVGLCYASMKKRKSYWEFEKRRLLRILPKYLLIGGGTYLLYDIFFNHFGCVKFLSDLFFVSWISAGSTKYWYILAIVVFYLLFPPLYWLIHSGSNAIVRTVLFCIIWWFAEEFVCVLIPEIASFRIALARLPIFAIGIFFGKYVYEKHSVHKGGGALLVLCGYVAFILLKMPVFKPISEFLYYPVRAFLGMSIITTTVLAMNLVERKTPYAYLWINRILGWFGSLTLELYLFHQSLMILYEYPYKLLSYITVAFIFPTIAAGLFFLGKTMVLKEWAK